MKQSGAESDMFKYTPNDLLVFDIVGLGTAVMQGLPVRDTQITQPGHEDVLQDIEDQVLFTRLRAKNFSAFLRIASDQLYVKWAFIRQLSGSKHWSGCYSQPGFSCA